MTEKELEKLFREKLSGDEVPYDPSAWERMSHLMYRRQSPVAAGWKAAAVIFIAIALAAGSLIVGLESDKSGSPDSPELLAPAENEPTPSSPADEETPASKDTDEGEHKIAGDQNDEDEPGPTGSEETKPTIEEDANTTESTEPIAGNAAGEVIGEMRQLKKVRISFLDPSFQHSIRDAGQRPVPAPRTDIPFKRKKLLPGTWSIHGGLNLSQGRRESGDPALDREWFAGLRYRHPLNRNWGISAEAGYSRRGSVNAVREYEYVQYGFGPEKITTQVNTQRLHYLEMPLYASWYPSMRHEFDFGIYGAYLLEVNNKITTIHQTKRTTTTETERETGYSAGLSNWDYGVLLGYSYRLNTRLSAGGRFQLGVNDITRDEDFEAKSFDNSLQIRILLRYELF